MSLGLKGLMTHSQNIKEILQGMHKGMHNFPNPAKIRIYWQLLLNTQVLDSIWVANIK